MVFSALRRNVSSAWQNAPVLIGGATAIIVALTGFFTATQQLIPFLAPFKCVLNFFDTRHKQTGMQPQVSETTTELDIRNKAYSLAEKRHFQDAIQALKLIPPASTSFHKAQDKIREWQNLIIVKQNAQDHKVLTDAKDAAIKKDFVTAIKLLDQIQPSSSKYTHAQEKRVEYSNKLIQQNDTSFALLNEAYVLAAQYEFQQAIDTLSKIQPGERHYPDARKKIREYQDKLQQQADVIAHHKIQKADSLASEHKFLEAIGLLKLIPETTLNYSKAQERILLYTRLCTFYKKCG